MITMASIFIHDDPMNPLRGSIRFTHSFDFQIYTGTLWKNVYKLNLYEELGLIRGGTTKIIVDNFSGYTEEFKTMLTWCEENTISVHVLEGITLSLTFDNQDNADLFWLRFA